MPIEAETRPPREIQRAHDILKAAKLGEIPCALTAAPEGERALTAALDALCWVLKHDHNTTFAENLQMIEDYAETCGFVLCDADAEASA